MCFAEAVCTARLEGRREEEAAMVNAVGQERAEEWRSRAQALILSLAERTHKL
jgi:hypothetical protein